MHVAQFFDPFLFRIHIEIVISRLPEWALRKLDCD